VKSSVVAWVAVSVWVSLLGSGCGGGGNGPVGFNVGGASMCGVVAPCGGNVVGTWTASVGCVTSAGLRQAESGITCSGFSLSVTNVSVSGTFTFNADMTYSFTGLSEQAMYQISAPVGCVAGHSCASAATGIESTGEFDSASCTGVSTCTCSAVQTPIVDTESGTYTLSGTTFTTFPRNGLPTSTLPYCVEGTNLHILATVTPSLGAMGQMVVEEDTVAQKQ
jgi:hypothetical protein